MTTAVDELVAQLWPGRRVRVERLTGGMTNANFLADFGDEQVVVRIPGKNTGQLGIDRGFEAQANRLAAAIGVAPEVLDESQSQGYMVTRFLVGRPVLPAELAKEPMLGEVAKTLRRVHDAGAIDWQFNPFNVVRDYHQLAQANNVVEPFDFFLAQSVVNRIESIRGFRPIAFCHNDLLNENFLFDGQLRILDWEYAGMGDPFFDLANFSINHALSTSDDEILLTHYFGALEPHSVGALQLMKLVSELREAMWGVVQMTLSSLDIDFAAYSKGKSDRFMVLLKEMDLEALLDSVSHF
jgi:thiamine kinase-like enzyme